MKVTKPRIINDQEEAEEAQPLLFIATRYGNGNFSFELELSVLTLLRWNFRLIYWERRIPSKASAGPNSALPPLIHERVPFARAMQ